MTSLNMLVGSLALAAEGYSMGAPLLRRYSSIRLVQNKHCTAIIILMCSRRQGKRWHPVPCLQRSIAGSSRVVAGPGQVCVPAYSHNIGEGHLQMPQVENLSIGSHQHAYNCQAKQQLSVTGNPDPQSKPEIGQSGNCTQNS